MTHEIATEYQYHVLHLMLLMKNYIAITSETSVQVQDVFRFLQDFHEMRCSENKLAMKQLTVMGSKNMLEGNKYDLLMSLVNTVFLGMTIFMLAVIVI